MRRLIGLMVVLACMVSMTAGCPAIGADKIVHEQQWIVDSVGRDVAEILLFAAKKIDNNAAQNLKFGTQEIPNSDSKYIYTYKFAESEPEQKRDIDLVDFVWSPESYSAFATDLTKQLKLTAEKSTSSDADADAFIAALSNYSSELLADQNKKISSALTANPLDPALHEQAALLLATFALRESASCFDDKRPALNRISAHLTLAKSLRDKNELGAAGKIAAATLMCMGGRVAGGVGRIDAMSATPSSDATKSWLRALKISATRDYRLADLDKASTVERIQYGRALADNIGADYLTDYLKKQGDKATVSTIDWLRVGARGIHSVEAGHFYAEPGVQAEMIDFARDFQLHHGRPIGSWEEATEQLSFSPTRCLIVGPEPRLEVVSWGDLSAFHARHLLDSVFQKFYFEKSRWGVPDQAKKTWDHAERSFSKVKLFPLCKMSHEWLVGKKCDPNLSADLNDLIARSPESINSNLWHRIVFTSANPDQVAKPATWFSPRMLFGTAFDFWYRNFKGQPEFTLDELDKLRAINPYDNTLISNWAYTKYPGGSFTAEELAAAYGHLAETDVEVMTSIANKYKDDPDKYIQQMEKIAQFKPDFYFEVGDLYVKNKQPEKAKVAYENGVRLGRNSVMVSNNCNWLVNYYYDHGQPEKALSLAKDAAEVYSYIGLETLAKLYERMGKLTDAEEYFARIYERYDYAGDLAGFYVRHKAANKQYQSKYDNVIKSVFPSGLVKAPLSALKGSPKTGVVITSPSHLTEKYGLHYKDVFVAINGYRMESMTQYHFLRTFDRNPELEFTVWNGKEYRNVKAVLPRRKWECGISDYEGK